MTEHIISSGIPSLDGIIKGYTRGSVIAYWTDHTPLRLSVIKAYTRSNSGVTLFITTQFRPEELNGMATDGSSIIYIDAISWRYRRVNTKYRSNGGKYDVVNLTDLNNLFAKITQAIKDNPNITSIVFDTMSNLLIYSIPGKEQVYRFFELFTAFTRSNEINLIYTINRLIHDTEVLETFRFLSDGTIEFSQRGEKQMVKIHDLLTYDSQSDWFSLA